MEDNEFLIRNIDLLVNEEDFVRDSIEHYYPVKYKYVVIERSKKLASWGKYNLWLYEEKLFITQKTHLRSKCSNYQKEHIVIQIPKFMLHELLLKKRLNYTYIINLEQQIKGLKAQKVSGL